MKITQFIFLLISSVVGTIHGQICTQNECFESSLPKPMGSGLSGYTPGGSGCYGDGMTVTYICTGTLIGPPTSQCSGGNWFPPVGPTCEAATGCSRPQLPSNGNVTEYKNDYALFERITFSCEDGYSIIGPHEAVCDSGGFWDPSNLPTCEASCMAPSIDNGAPNGTFSHGEVITYACDVNYTLVGDSTATCRDGSWEPNTVPQCIGKCLPPIVANSNFRTQQEVIDHGSSVIIDCDAGYSTGSSMITILRCNYGSLSGETPQCYENCPIVVPEAFSAFYGAAPPYEHGDTVTFTCYHGYEIYNGSLTSRCMNGQWSSDPPFCSEQTTTTHDASSMTLPITETHQTTITAQETPVPVTHYSPQTSHTSHSGMSTVALQTFAVSVSDTRTDEQTISLSTDTSAIPATSTDMSADTLTSLHITPSATATHIDTTVRSTSHSGNTGVIVTDENIQNSTSLGEQSTTAQTIVTSQWSASDDGLSTSVEDEMMSSTTVNVSIPTTEVSARNGSSIQGISEDQKVIVIVMSTALGAVTVLALVIALISCHHTRKGTSDKNTYDTNTAAKKTEHAYDNNGIVLKHL